MSHQMESLGLMELSAVRELSNIGLGHATTALSELTQRPFNMTVPNAESVAMDDIPERLGSDEQAFVGIYMPIEGEIGGHMAFLFPWASAQSLWRMLLGSAPESPAEVDEMYASATLEVGNIINSSFLNAISDMTGASLHATPPLMAIEMASAILQAIVSEASYRDHVALSIQTEIYDENGSVDGTFFYIPTVGGLHTLFARLGIAEAA